MTVFAEIRLPMGAYPIGELLSIHPDVRFEIDEVVPVGSATHYVWLRGRGGGSGPESEGAHGIGEESDHDVERKSDHDVERQGPAGGDGLVDRLRELASVKNATVIDELPDRRLVRIELVEDASPLLDLVEAADATLVSAEGSLEGLDVQVRFESDEALRRFHDQVRTRYGSTDVRAVFEPGYAADSVRCGMSPKQWETVEAAFEAGYFDIPRQATLGDIAEELGVSEQAVSERLRRGLATFLDGALHPDGEE